MMTVQQLIDKLKDMGFEETATMQEYQQLVLNAIERATEEINLLFPYVGEFEFEQDGITLNSGYNLELLIPDYNSLQNVYEIMPNGRRNRFTDYDMVDETIFLDNTRVGKFLILYDKRYKEVEEVTEYVQVNARCESMLELLTAYYVWLDDDERKAVMYYQNFETLKDTELQIQAARKSKFDKATIVGGID